MFSATLSPTLSATSLISAGVNPWFSINTVYVLGGSKGMVKVPDPLVVASRFKPVPLLVAVTCAPGTTALFGSVTVPLSVAVEDCACATAKGKAQRARSSKVRRAKGEGLRFMMLVLSEFYPQI